MISSRLRNSLTRMNETGGSPIARAKLIKREMWMLRNQLEKEPKPRTPQYIAAYLSLREAYHAAKQILEGAYKNNPKKRQKLLGMLSLRTTITLDAVENLNDEQ